MPNVDSVCTTNQFSYNLLMCLNEKSSLFFFFLLEVSDFFLELVNQKYFVPVIFFNHKNRRPVRDLTQKEAGMDVWLSWN